MITMFEVRNLDNYVWIPGFEWYYKINNEWNIISYRKRCQNWAELTERPQRFIKPRIKVSSSSKKRFLAVTLYDWLKKQKFYVSRLVAHLFMNYDLNDNTKQIIFKDWNPKNCKMKNLQIGTVSERTLLWINKKHGTIRRRV